MQRLSIIIPAHNEERRIGATLQDYTSFFDDLTKRGMLDYEIIVVLNACKDKTKDVVKKHQTARIKILEFIQAGKGFAVIEGFKDALARDNDIIGFVDADMATPPDEYLKLVQAIEGYDVTIADRYLPASVIIPRPTIARLFAKRLFNFLTRCLLFLPYHDTQCGAKVFRQDVLREIIPSLSMSQWAFDVELLYVARKQGYLVKPVATRWFDKEYSKINFWKAGPGMALGVIRLRIINSAFRGLMDIYHRFVSVTNVKTTPFRVWRS